jgi:hypothetical protein
MSVPDTKPESQNLQARFERALFGKRLHALPKKGGTRTWNMPKDSPIWLDASTRWQDKNPGCNFYFSPVRFKPNSKTSKKPDVQSSQWVWLDLDPRTEEITGELFDKERRAMLWLLTGDLPDGVPEPTFIIDSGRGYWGLWKLKFPHALDGPGGDETRVFEAVLRGLANAFGGFGDRSVINSNRIVRLPTTINLKTGQRAEVVEFNPISYTLADFPSIVVERRPRRTESDAESIPTELLEKMLAATPYSGGPQGLDDRRGYKGWLDFAMSVHEACNGDADGLDAFTKWCQDDSGFTGDSSADKMQAHWESFDSGRVGGLTRGSWIKLLGGFAGNKELVSEAMSTTADADFADDGPEDFAPMGLYNIKTGKYEFTAAEAGDFKYGNRPGINVTKIDGNLPLLSRKVQKLFVKAVAKPEASAADQVFDRGGDLVHLSRNRLPPGAAAKFDKDFHVENDLVIKEAESEWLADTLERTFTFFRRTVKTDKKTKLETTADIPCNVPMPVVKRMFAISQDWQYPNIKGTVETPTLRLDGTILDKPGFDKKSGLYFDPGAMKFPEIRDRPTKADALTALAILRKVLVDFPFADEDGIAGLSESVALAMLLTAVCRRSLPIAPMFGIDAHEANTGKTQLAQVAAILMTGHATAARPGLPADEYQLTNALAAAFSAGDAMILYDNIDGDKQSVTGAALNAALTSEMYGCRRLGGNGPEDQIMARSNSLMVATGNKLTFEGDMSEDRSLVCTLRTDKTLAERSFAHWPLDAYVIEMRAALVSAALTILRAYRIAKKEPGPSFRFEAWRDVVADALVWLKLPDPVLSTERAKAENPTAEARRNVMRAWLKCIGGAELTTADALKHDEVRAAIAEARGIAEHKLLARGAAEYLKGMVGIKLNGFRLLKRTVREQFQWVAVGPAGAELPTVDSPPTVEDAEQAERDFGFADDVEDLM